MASCVVHEENSWQIRKEEKWEEVKCVNWKKFVLAGAMLAWFLLPQTGVVANSAAKVRVYDSLKDGVYDAVVTTESGGNGVFASYDLHVSVTVSDHVITGISYNGAVGENAAYAQEAYNGVVEQIVGKRDSVISVDTVSGATRSTDAFVTAINKGLKAGSFVGPDLHEIVVNKQGNQISFETVDGCESYCLYRNGKKIAALTQPAYLDTKAKKNGTKYTYRVSAVVNGTESDWSDGVSCCYLERNAINILINGSPGKMTFTWNKNKKADGYEVQYGTSKSFRGAKTLKISNKSMVISTASNVHARRNYYVRVRSYKKLGQETFYSEWSKARKLHINR